MGLVISAKEIVPPAASQGREERRTEPREGKGCSEVWLRPSVSPAEASLPDRAGGLQLEK